MFTYYGAKRQMAKRYDAPAFPLIIEPFAGSAAYSLYHLASVDRALLIEKDERVVELWRRLLEMEPADVLALPVPAAGDETADFLHMTVATSNAIAGSSRMTVTERMPRKIASMLIRISRELPQAKRKVELVLGDYRSAPDVEATWFIDPPYQATRQTTYSQGMGYAKGCKSTDLDYSELGAWCQQRRGQVIVCEQAGADWLPFRPLAATFDSVAGDLREVVWTSPGYGQQILCD